MGDKERSVSLGTVVAFGFIILGILNLVGALHYKKPSPISINQNTGYFVHGDRIDHSRYKSDKKNQGTLST